MFSTYFLPTFDMCPDSSQGNPKGSGPIEVDGVRVWFREKGDDAAQC